MSNVELKTKTKLLDAKMDAEFKQVDAKMDAEFKRMDSEFKEVHAKMDAKFKQMYTEFNSLKEIVAADDKCKRVETYVSVSQTLNESEPQCTKTT
jgi:hypothetical protein